MAIGNAIRWVGGQDLLHSQLNSGVSRLLAERAGRHGVVELEGPLSILSGDDGDRYVQLPVGTSAQRPPNPEPGYMRFNTTINDAEYWNGSAWRPFQQDLSAILTFENFVLNGVVGDAPNQVPEGNHAHPLTIVSFSVSPTSVRTSANRTLPTVQCAVSASRSLTGNPITYRWSASSGTFSASSAASTIWTPSRSAITRSVTISVTVSDGATSVTRSRAVSAIGNRAPVVTAASITISRKAGVRTTVSLTGTASDPDGDRITSYDWTPGPRSRTGIWHPGRNDAGRTISFVLAASDGLESGSRTAGSITVVGPGAPSVTASDRLVDDGSSQRWGIYWSAPSSLGDGGPIVAYEVERDHRGFEVQTDRITGTSRIGSSRYTARLQRARVRVSEPMRGAWSPWVTVRN